MSNNNVGPSPQPRPTRRSDDAGGFSVGQISRQAKKLPNRTILNAVGGWGKSSISAQIPGAVFLLAGQETGLWTLMDAGQVPTDTPHFPEPAQTVNQVVAAIRSLIDHEHSHRALVIDSISEVETMLQRKVCMEHYQGNWDMFNQFAGDQAGKVVAKEWEPILELLDALRAKGIGVMLLTHARVVNFKNPFGPDYERWESLNKHSWARLFNWADTVLFGSFEEVVSKRDRRKSDAETKGKASGGQVRVLHCERSAAHDAKNRSGLPPVVECGNSAAEAWANYSSALKAARAAATVAATDKK